jgi:hypothetical protein
MVTITVILTTAIIIGTATPTSNNTVGTAIQAGATVIMINQPE